MSSIKSYVGRAPDRDTGYAIQRTETEKKIYMPDMASMETLIFCRLDFCRKNVLYNYSGETIWL